jgi:hypothetical protein
MDRYKHPDALAVTHRGSEEYRRMRSSMVPEAITEEPSDLRPLKPTGIGFMARHGETHAFADDGCRDQFLVVRRFVPRNGGKKAALEALGEVAEEAARDTSQGEVLSFWVLEYASELEDETVVTIERYGNKVTFEEVATSLQRYM